MAILLIYKYFIVLSNMIFLFFMFISSGQSLQVFVYYESSEVILDIRHWRIGLK